MWTAAGSGYASFLVQILRQPVWLVGLALQISGWLLQAVALDNGPLAMVQSICALSIVLALPFEARLTAQRITTTVVVGALLTVVGIVLFLVVGAPRRGTGTPPGEPGGLPARAPSWSSGPAHCSPMSSSEHPMP